MNTDKVTRVEVIDFTTDPAGRVFVKRDCTNVMIDLQDNNKTLKVFIEDTKIKPQKKIWKATFGIKCFETGEEWKFGNQEDMLIKLKELENLNYE